MSIFNQISGWLSRSSTKPVTQEDLIKALNTVMAKLSVLDERLKAIGAQLSKAAGEIKAQVAELKQALEDVEIPEAAQASLDQLAEKVQQLDDLNPDKPEEPPAANPTDGGTSAPTGEAPPNP